MESDENIDAELVSTKIHFTPPNNNGEPITNYHFTLNDNLQTKTPTADSVYPLLLDSASIYHLSITSENVLGKSQPSMTKKIETLMLKPVAPVFTCSNSNNIAEESTTQLSFQVTFDTNSYNHTLAISNNNIYKLEMRVSTSKKWKDVLNNLKATDLTRPKLVTKYGSSNLQENSIYHLRLTGKNKIGVGKFKECVFKTNYRIPENVEEDQISIDKSLTHIRWKNSLYCNNYEVKIYSVQQVQDHQNDNKSQPADKLESRSIESTRNPLVNFFQQISQRLSDKSSQSAISSDKTPSKLRQVETLKSTVIVERNLIHLEQHNIHDSDVLVIRPIRKREHINLSSEKTAKFVVNLFDRQKERYDSYSKFLEEKEKGQRNSVGSNQNQLRHRNIQSIQEANVNSQNMTETESVTESVTPSKNHHKSRPNLKLNKKEKSKEIRNKLKYKNSNSLNTLSKTLEQELSRFSILGMSGKSTGFMFLLMFISFIVLVWKCLIRDDL